MAEGSKLGMKKRWGLRARRSHSQEGGSGLRGQLLGGASQSSPEQK